MSFNGNLRVPRPGDRPARVLGYWKDHVAPLACGPDAVSDLEWQTIGDAKAQDVGTKGVRSVAAGLFRRRAKV